METYEQKYKEALEKAKAYDKAIEKLRDFYRDYDTVSHLIDVKEELANLFPELTESEDEKVRKELLDYCKNKAEKYPNDPKYRNIGDWIAWLENIPITIDHAKREGFHLGYKACLEKQGEQKSTDKVEPKFHEGDWVVQENIGTYKVIEVCESWYEVIDDQDNRYSIGFDKEYMCHLWTIQDAKNGDVLYYKSDCGVEFIVMSNGVNKSNNIDSYFRYNSNDGFGIDIPNVFSAKQDNITPATKEQRDTLMKAMTDAGWEFDFEKKELKKIEKKSDEYSDTEKQEMFIRSQRPHFWKPTDKQMDTLLSEVTGWTKGCPKQKVLESLYNDLKKLREGEL